MQLRKSSKKQAKIKLALQDCAGSGKAYSALLLAYGLCGDWTKIAVIDSENNSADLYTHLGQYNVLPLEGKYDPETYIDAIKVCKPERSRGKLMAKNASRPKSPRCMRLLTSRFSGRPIPSSWLFKYFFVLTRKYLNSQTCGGSSF